MQIVDVPAEFRPRGHVTYPPHQRGLRVEEAHADYFGSVDTKTSAVYLPILWDTYLVDHQYGKDVGALQAYVENVVKEYHGKTLWTVCEYADGIKVHIDNPSRFGVFYCGCHGGVSLPLLCDPHPVRDGNRATLASFVGVIDNYPIRRTMRAVCTGPEFSVGSTATSAEFQRLMANSKFALCPRGYGPTSYRLYEAIQMGCVPVYIYDEPHLPYADELDWSEFCVLVPESELGRLPNTLKEISHKRWQNMQERCTEVYKSHFNMRSTCEWVKKHVEGRWA